MTGERRFYLYTGFAKRGSAGATDEMTGVFDLLGMAMGQAFQGESVVAWTSSTRIHPVRQRQASTSERCLLGPPAVDTQPARSSVCWVC
ncbi:unnamed protein product, partial [Ectocarpus sp. 12 AP-2014]